ncbi:MAG: hypothetical protein CVU41_07325 [Chloroflexi bacterium HGW-Chloroflexi-3]|nr:MAG: hypothetical protein CVU41_07325 [Chloroflexi bacterium HGW-Chloroflexi-3]
MPGKTAGRDPQRKRTPLLHFRASSAIYSEPYGQVLIMAPWNYPFHLLFSPLLGLWQPGIQPF